MAMTTATRVIRFVDDMGIIRCGERESETSPIARLVEHDDPLGSLEFTGKEAVIRKLLAPIAPTQIIGIGLNYTQHAIETHQPIPKYPVVFSKGLNAVQNPNDPIYIPHIARNPPEVDYECELAVVLKAPCKNVKVEDALQYVAGYTCANDVSSRLWQNQRGGGQWNRSKTFDTFCPLGPVFVPASVIRDPQTLELSTHLNGKCMQKSTTADMIFSVAELISQLSQDTTLPRGAVILTGTPSGVGVGRHPQVFLAPGDVVEIEVEKIGKLTNTVMAASSL